VVGGRRQKERGGEWERGRGGEGENGRKGEWENQKICSVNGKTDKII
jgi:hypothetical protein